jgi:chromate transport protein ChrA
MITNKQNNIHKVLGATFIIIGVVLYPTPIPGTTILAVLGFVWLIGKDRTLIFLKRILSKNIFKKLQIRNIVKKI